MALTDRREPHDSQDIKNIRFSFVRRVSGDLHVLQVTYSTVGYRHASVNKPFLGCISRDARLTDISPQYVLYLFWLEAALDDQSPRTVNTSRRTHLGKEELNNVFWRPVHTLADICDIRKDGAADTFSEDLGWGNGVPLSCGGEEGRIRGVEGGIETCEELDG